MNKTAADFYDQQLHIIDLRLKSGNITIEEYFTLKSELYTKAKQMEKEQIVKAAANAFEDMFGSDGTNYGVKYYESKYGKDENTQI